MIEKNIRLLALHNFFNDFRLYAGIAILYFAEITGSYTLGMAVFSIVLVSSAIFEVPTGIYSDLIGRKKTMIFSSSASIIAVTFFAISSNFLFLAIGAILEGLAKSFASGNNHALLYDSLKQVGKEDKYHFFLGRVDGMFQAGLAVSALIGGVLLFFYPYRIVFLLSIIPQVITLIISFFIKEPQAFTKGEGNVYSHLKEAFHNFRINSKLKLLSISDMLRFSLGEAAFLYRGAFLITLWPAWAISIAQTLTFGLGTLSFFLAGRFVEKFTPLKSLILEIGANRVINTLALVFPTVFSPILMTITSIFHGIGHVAMGTLMQKEFSEKQRATMGSLNSLLSAIGFAIISLGIGYVSDKIGPVYTLLIIQALFLIPLLIYWKIFHHEKV